MHSVTPGLYVNESLQLRHGWEGGMQQLLEFVEEVLIPVATPEPGLWAQPNGRDIYRAYLRCVMSVSTP